jgi:predicted amidophosphoribosyltransferase
MARGKAPNPRDHVRMATTRKSAKAHDLVALCRECRRALPADWQLCSGCEARLRTRCPECGLPLPPAGASHCGHCGYVIRAR